MSMILNPQNDDVSVTDEKKAPALSDPVQAQLLYDDEYVDSSDGLIYCKRCHGPRMKIFSNSSLRKTFTVRIPCSCLEAQKKKEEEERTMKERLAKVFRLRSSSLMDRSMLHSRFENAQFDNPYLPKAQAYVDNWKTMEDSGKGLLIWGPVGTGKSFFAGCIANALIDQCVPVLMTGIIDLQRALNSLYPDEQSSYNAELDRYSLLIIDDLGAERKTEYSTEQVFNIIDRRCRIQKPMIVTTNLTLNEMKNTTDINRQRIYDRLLQHCSPLLINGINYRKLLAEENLQKTRILLSQSTSSPGTE